jgi:hypothetical protein
MRSDTEVRDPLEDVPELRRAFRQASLEAHSKTKRHDGHLGAIHLYWDEKKRILKEKYSIDWMTPAELNPNICYD